MCKQKFDTLRFNLLRKIKYFFDLNQADKEFYIKYQFKKAVGYDLDLRNPKTFNEKIQWYKLFYRNDLMTKCADKFLAREYIKEKIGEEYSIPLINSYNSPDEIDFDALPEQFVLKVNWGAGQNIIVTDKSKLDIKDTKKKLKKWLKKKHNHYFHSFEWAYKNIKPKIICEKFINEIDDVRDYKFYCFNGEVKYMLVCGERRTSLYEDFYDMDLNFLPFTNGARNSLKPLIKPVSYEKMVELAKILSKPFPHVRVDFYEDALGQPKFGEMTFYSGNGMDTFEPIEYDYQFGKDLILPNLNGVN